MTQPVASTCFASFASACPHCDRKVVGGQLLCCACQAVFLLRGAATYYSPILNEFVRLAGPEGPAKSTGISRKMATRLLFYGRSAERRSQLVMTHRVVDRCMQQLVRWRSGVGWSQEKKIEMAQNGSH